VKQVVDKIELFSLCFVAFTIPLNVKIASIFIGILFVLAFLKKDNYSNFYKMLKTPAFYILILPYLFFLLGLINTDIEHMKDAKVQVELTLSLLVFPIIVTAFKSNKIKNAGNYIFSFFVIGLLVAYFTCLSISLSKFILDRNFEFFFYQELSQVVAGAHHLSYFVFFGIMILASNLLGQIDLYFSDKKYLRLKTIIILVLSIFLFQLSSKATIILFLISSLIIFIYIVSNKIIPLKYSLGIISIIIIFIIIGFSTQKVNMRFSKFVDVMYKYEEFNPKSQESTALRISALKTGVEVAKSNFWFGTGTGDLLYEMNDYYKDNYYQAAYIKYISPHNQFVRSFAMHGVFGFLSLISIFALMIYTAIKRKSFLLWIWIIMMLVLFNVEDMFGIQSGIVFFSFFTSLILLSPELSKVNEIVKNSNFDVK